MQYDNNLRKNVLQREIKKQDLVLIIVIIHYIYIALIEALNALCSSTTSVQHPPG